MSPRHKKASDDDVFAATFRAMQRLGPGELTLAEIGAEAGVTAGALVQRFGSKRDLLLAFAAAGATQAADVPVASPRSGRASPLAALRDHAACMANLAPSPAALARNLAYLQIDVADPDFRKHLLAQYQATRSLLESLVAAAITAGELDARARPESLARLLEAALSGALLTWAIYREQSAESWLRSIVDTLLAPYLVQRPRPRRRQR